MSHGEPPCCHAAPKEVPRSRQAPSAQAGPVGSGSASDLMKCKVETRVISGEQILIRPLQGTVPTGSLATRSGCGPILREEVEVAPPAEAGGRGLLVYWVVVVQFHSGQ